jgi:photosystem II stability/assembly factor-like uncharacterized protein
MFRRFVHVMVPLCLCAALPLTAQLKTPLDSATLAGFRWRNIGPANTMGRVADVRGIPSPSRTFFVAAAAGGIWKTTNGGVTFRPVFDHEPVVSMGQLAIAPSDTMQVWAGTGEPNVRNSVSPGQGIYKSTDGGLTWKLMGLEKTQTIGRIVVHPTDPNTVWVAASGAEWNDNPDRGLYKTTDGGQTWKLVKFINNRTGFIDVALDPQNPDILFASSWERIRTPYSFTSGGPGSALWKSTDGGDHWLEVKGGGFPATMKGRIGLAFAPSNGNIIYALVEADSEPNAKGKPGVGRPQELQSGLYRSEDQGATWTKMASNDVRPFYYSQVRVDPQDPNRVYWSSTPLNFSDDGGKTVKQTTVGVHVDHHAMWIDPNDGRRIIVGDDGGVSESFDRGGNWLVLNSIAIGQLYDVSFDYAIPYNVCGGLQDNGAWCGPSRRKSGPITNSMWYTITGGDGFYTAQDPTNPDIVYGESQGGDMARVNVATGQSVELAKPNASARMHAWEDSIALLLDDSAHANTSAVRRRVAEIRATIAADSSAYALRWNWESPFFLSPLNPSILYAGANRVLKSVNHGDSLFAISPDLTYADSVKVRISTRTTGGITNDATGAETFATIVSLAESYITPGVLYAGTDDGRTWLSRNDGGNWDELTGRFPGVPAGTYVSRIEPSYADSNVFYVAFDNHRNGDYTPYLYMTTDFGRTFHSIVNNLPRGGPDFVHVVREDPADSNVLFVGTDVAAYVSTDRGGSWQRFMTGMPTVPVYDLKIQPRDHELIAATFGRAIWIVDINAVSQLRDSNITAALTVMKPTVAYQYGDRLFDGQSTGQGVEFEGTSPTYGASIEYRVTGASGSRATANIVIQDVTGDTVRNMTGPAGDGLHDVAWDFRYNPPPANSHLSPSEFRDSVEHAHRIVYVFDSLKKAGADTTALARVHHLVEQSEAGGRGNALGRGFGGGRGGPNPEAWVERPGERANTGRGGGGFGRGRGALAGAGADSVLAETVQRLITPLGGAGRGGRGGFGRGLTPTAEPGDYRVIVTVGGKSASTVLRVERASGSDDDDGFMQDRDALPDAGSGGDPLALIRQTLPGAGSLPTLATLVANLTPDRRGSRQAIRPTVLR